MRLFNIVLLAASSFVSYVSGFEISERALTVTDIPPCGVCRPFFLREQCSCSNNADDPSSTAFYKPFLLLDVASWTPSANAQARSSHTAQQHVYSRTVPWRIHSALRRYKLIFATCLTSRKRALSSHP